MREGLPASEYAGRWRAGGMLASPHQRRAGDPHPANWSDVEIVLDLSHLLSRLWDGAPTTSDRIELAYARALRKLVPDRLGYAAVHPSGAYGRFGADQVEAFLDRMEGRWESSGGRRSRIDGYRFALGQFWSLRPRPIVPPAGRRVLLQVSSHQLHQPHAIRRKLRCEQARFVCLVTDLSLALHPEYADPENDARSAQRLKTIEALADGILVPSHAMRDALIHRAGDRLRQLPIRVEPLGVELRRAPEAADADVAPYFLCIGTIEPRSNHLLLLNLWRSIAEAVGRDRAPRLLLIGCRGSQHPSVVDMLRRCPALQGVVQEVPPLSDCDLRQLVRGARAVLKPSFAVDSGMTMTAALAAGAPVLASDIPAHRAAGGAIPEYIDPIDGDGWRSAVLSYQAPASIRRALQLERIARWRPLSWREHVKTALSLITEVAAC